MLLPAARHRRDIAAAAAMLALVTVLALYARREDQASWEVELARVLRQSGPPGLRTLSVGLATAGASPASADRRPPVGESIMGA